jgi:hypothetical protein
MQKALGFTSFDSSKGKNHIDSASEGVFIAKDHRRKYR